MNDFRVRGGHIAWSPDSKFIVAVHDTDAEDHLPAGIYLVPVDGSEARRIVSTTVGTSHAVLSPDGQDIAYVPCKEDGSSCDLYVAHLGQNYAPVGTSHPVETGNRNGFAGVAWTADGRELVYSSAGRLWRTPASGMQGPKTVEVGSFNASDPDIGRAGHRLAFTRSDFDEDVYRLAIGGSLTPLLTSAFFDIDPEYSPDGTRVAFASDRAGELEIWVANADGSEARQLTHRAGHVAGSPDWSPDGRRLVFDGPGDDTHDSRVWTINTEGGTARQLTSGPGEQVQPTWSADGTYIYFSSTAGGQRNIWRTPAAGGAAQQVTHTGAGRRAFEARSGQYLLYQSAEGNAPLLLLPTQGNPAKQIVACVRRTAFTIARDSVDYVSCNADNPTLHRLDPLTGRDQVLGALPNIAEWEPHISVSPDARSVLYAQQMSPDKSTKLMLIENFR